MKLIEYELKDKLRKVKVVKLTKANIDEVYDWIISHPSGVFKDAELIRNRYCKYIKTNDVCNAIQSDNDKNDYYFVESFASYNDVVPTLEAVKNLDMYDETKTSLISNVKPSYLGDKITLTLNPYIKPQAIRLPNGDQIQYAYFDDDIICRDNISNWLLPIENIYGVEFPTRADAYPLRISLGNKKTTYDMTVVASYKSAIMLSYVDIIPIITVLTIDEFEEKFNKYLGGK